MVSISSQIAILYLTIIEIAATLISTIISAIYIFLLHKRISSDDGNLIKYRAISGICFGLGTIIYFSLIGNQNYYLLVSSFQFGHMIVLAPLINRIKQEPLQSKNLFGIVLVVAGFVLLSVTIAIPGQL